MILKEGPASHRVKFQAIGGNLYLHSGELVFKPHSINFSKEIITISLKEVLSVQKKWNKIFGLIPLVPNIIEIQLLNNKKYQFMVFKRDLWIEEISKAIDDLKSEG